jgi:hypothetical protein
MKADSAMKADFEAIPAVATLAERVIGDELTFTFPEVLEVIRLCSEHQIAVLGPDLFNVGRDGRLETEKLSAYHLQLKKNPKQSEEWPDYVRINNTLAEEFVRQNPAGDDHVYVLTTASWREFHEMK